MSIWNGFEGYRDPAEEQVIDLLREAAVVVDTNVLLDLYPLPEPARNLALDALEFLQDRLFVPHQVMREFWRHRQSVVADVKKPDQPLDRVQDELLRIVNSLRPDRERTDELDAIRSQIETTLGELRTQIDAARGEPLNQKQILQHNSLDPVLRRLEVILEGRVGSGFGEEETSAVAQGLERFAVKTPPGYMDGKDKQDQIPEQGTGDYLLWEQSLRHVASLPQSKGFVLVTNDSKEDWRTTVMRPEKQTLGVRPELVAEALARTQGPFVLLDAREFYRLVNTIRTVDASASFSLTSALDSVTEGRSRNADEWTASAYAQLIADLRRDGYTAQADAIILAAQSGGFARRADIYEAAGYGDDRSLRRFSLPAQRAAIALIDSGALPGGASFPLEAVYEGPGKATGYEVPPEFVRFEAPDPVFVDFAKPSVGLTATISSLLHAYRSGDLEAGTELLELGIDPDDELALAHFAERLSAAQRSRRASE